MMSTLVIAKSPEKAPSFSGGGLPSYTCTCAKMYVEMNHEINFHVEIISHADVPFYQWTNKE